MANEEELESDGRDGLPRGLIRKKLHAIVAVAIAFIVSASAFHSAVTKAVQSRWLFETGSHSYLFGKSVCIVLSIFFWCFGAWILFWLYRAARDKNERFLVGGFAVGYVLGVIGGFLLPSVQVYLEFASTAAFLVSFASSLTILTKLSSDKAPG